LYSGWQRSAILRKKGNLVAVTHHFIPSTDPRLGRHVRHDDRSWDYRFSTAGLTLTSTKHTRRIPVLDQGNLGSCVPNAAEGNVGTDPFFDTLPGVTWGEPLAQSWYSEVTAADPYPGQWPPDDTGSDGLSMAKVLKAKGLISGYQHTFTLNDALLALTVRPVITGVTWFNSMFDPTPDGQIVVDTNSGVAGGHEFVLDELDVENRWVWMTNSWNESWGLQGRAYFDWSDFGVLLADQGDVTVFTPLTQPAPTPTPPGPQDPADVTFAAAFRGWAQHPRVLGSAKLKAAGNAWLVAKGL